MIIKTKFDFGDIVENNFGMSFTVRGIVVYCDGDIGYFDVYEENNDLEENLSLVKKGDKKNEF